MSNSRTTMALAVGFGWCARRRSGSRRCAGTGSAPGCRHTRQFRRTLPAVRAATTRCTATHVRARCSRAYRHAADTCDCPGCSRSWRRAPPVHRKRAAADGRRHPIALDRLDLILGLTRSDEEPDAAAQDRLCVAIERVGRRDARKEVVLLRAERITACRILDEAGGRVDDHVEVVALAQRSVVLVAQAVIQGGAVVHAPFVLRRRCSSPAACGAGRSRRG
jgi:hypothetical protein